MASADKDDAVHQAVEPLNALPPASSAFAKAGRRVSLGSLMGKPVFSGAKTSKAARTVNPLAQSQDRGLLFSLQPRTEDEPVDGEADAAAMPILPEDAQVLGAKGKAAQNEGSTWWGGAAGGPDPEEQDTHREKEDQQVRDQGKQQEGSHGTEMGSRIEGLKGGDAEQCLSGRSSFHSTELLCSPSALQPQDAPGNASPCPAADPLTREQSYQDAQHSFDQRGESAEPASPPYISKPDAADSQPQQTAPAAGAREVGALEQAAHVGSMAAGSPLGTAAWGTQHALAQEQPGLAGAAEQGEAEAASPAALEAMPERAASGTVDALSQLCMYDATPPPAAGAMGQGQARDKGVPQPEVSAAAPQGPDPPAAPQRAQEQRVESNPAADVDGVGEAAAEAQGQQSCTLVAGVRKAQEQQPAVEAAKEQAVAEVVEEQPAVVVAEQPAAVMGKQPAAELAEKESAAGVVEEQTAERVVEEQTVAEVVSKQAAAEVVEEQTAAEVVEEQTAAEVVEEQTAVEVAEEEPVAALVVEQPAVAIEEQQAAAMEERLPAAMEELPAVAMEVQPAVAMKEQPAAVMEEQPAAAMEEQPAAAMEEQPAAPEVVEGVQQATAESGQEPMAGLEGPTVDQVEEQQAAGEGEQPEAREPAAFAQAKLQGPARGNNSGAVAAKGASPAAPAPEVDMEDRQLLAEAAAAAPAPASPSAQQPARATAAALAAGTQLPAACSMAEAAAGGAEGVESATEVGMAPAPGREAPRGAPPPAECGAAAQEGEAGAAGAATVVAPAGVQACVSAAAEAAGAQAGPEAADAPVAVCAEGAAASVEEHAAQTTPHGVVDAPEAAAAATLDAEAAAPGKQGKGEQAADLQDAGAPVPEEAPMPADSQQALRAAAAAEAAPAEDPSSMDRGSSMDAATAARLAHELGVALAMESYTGSFGAQAAAPTPAASASGAQRHTMPCGGPLAAMASHWTHGSCAGRQAPAAATARPDQLGLLDMDMEDVGAVASPEQQSEAGGAEEGQDAGGMPPLEATPSPGPTSPAAGSLSAQMQMCRESIPLFVRDSYAVSDSVSLDRQSLNSLEPFGRPHPHATPAAAVAAPAATAAPLDTLHEEASFMEDLPPKLMAELQRPSQTPAAMQRSAQRAARAASAAGFDDHDFGDLPDDLPDPMMISPAPAPPPFPRAQAAPPAPPRPQFTSPSKPPLHGSSPAPMPPSTRKPLQPSPHAHGSYTHTPANAAAASDARARMGLPAQPPAVTPLGVTTPRAGGATPGSGSGRLNPRGAYTGSQGQQAAWPAQDRAANSTPSATPNGMAAPSPRLSRNSGGVGPADSASLSLSAQRPLGKTPTTARRAQLSGPTAYSGSPAAAAAAAPTPPSAAARGLPKSTSMPSPHHMRQQLPGPHATPAARAPSPPVALHTPNTGPLHAREAGGLSPAAPAATPPHAPATPAGQGHVPTAVMPTLPASLNTPMALMQRLPMDLAVNAPFLDQGSPFSEMDFGMDTTNIAEEAKRLMQSLAGPGGAHPSEHTGSAGRSGGPHTPEFGGSAHLLSHMKGTPHDFKFSSLAASQQTTPLPSHTPSAAPNHTPLANCGSKAGEPGPQQRGGAAAGFAEGSDISPGQAGFLETQNRMLMERLVAAEERAQVAEREVEQLRDQIKTINFGDMLQANGAGDMEHEARLYAEEQLQVSKAEVSGMQEAVRNMQQALSDTKATNSSQSAELKELRATSARDKQQLGQLLGKVAQLEAELAAEREQARQMHVELSNTSQQLATAQATAEARGAEVAKLARQRDEAQGSLKHSTEELIAAQLRHKQQVAEAAKQATAMQASMTKLQADKDALKRDGAAVYVRMKASESQVAAHKADVQRLKQENAELVRMAEELMCTLEKERQKNKAAGLR